MKLKTKFKLELLGQALLTAQHDITDMIEDDFSPSLFKDICLIDKQIHIFRAKLREYIDNN
jgi:hypothetical protein